MTQALSRKLRDNPLAQAEGAAGAPRINPAAIASYPFFALGAGKAYNTASGAAQVEFTSETLDKGGYFDATSAPYCRFTPLSPGWYEIETSLVVARDTQPTAVQVRKNGNVVASWNVLAGTGNMQRNISTVVQLNGSNDYVDVAVTNPGGSVTVVADGIGQNYIRGKKIAE